jgi:DNA-binding transcriptional LysR family regulator
LDTELARTFLTVIGAGSFIGAAERLHVTQSTVSARIHALEEQLGCILLVRNKAGTTLTPAGRRFQKHAAMLVRAVERARQEVGVPSGYQAALTVGGRFGLWEGLLLRWLEHFGEQAPDVSVRAEIGFEDDLMQGLVEGRIEIGVMYTPQSRPGLKVERLLEEQLVLVSTRAALEPGLGEGYVYVDWGPEFHARHSMFFPEFVRPRLVASIGWLGLQHILESGGSGFFPRRLIGAHLASGRLHVVPGAPDFRLPAYVVHPGEATPAVIMAVESIREIARAASEEPAQTAAMMNRRRKGNRVRPSGRLG